MSAGAGSHHRHLARQLRKLGLDENTPPSAEQWQAFLECVGKSYQDTDLERYTLKRSVALVEGEMQELNAKLESERDQLRLAFEAAPVGIMRRELDGRATIANPALQKMLGYTLQEIQALEAGQLIHPDEREATVATIKALASGQLKQSYVSQRRFLHKNGAIIHTNTSISVATDADGHPLFVVAVVKDISERIRLELELRQAQKLESVGRLASGIAHEINTPIQFVNDSLSFIRDAIDGYTAVIAAYQSLGDAMKTDPLWIESAARIAEQEDQADLAYLLENVPGAIGRCLDGVHRVATIVRSMKEFAHPDGVGKELQDLNHAIETTLAIARNEYTYVADVETDFGELPLVMCQIGELNQVVLNLIVNAAHAIGDVVKGTDRRGTIRIATRCDGDWARIQISDTGGGIPEGVREHVFEPFFTTKTVGRGTGQGLAISRSVVVDKHGGALTFETEVGKGTTFTIRLPTAAIMHTAA